jgi:small GTP-binding protein
MRGTCSSSTWQLGEAECRRRSRRLRSESATWICPQLLKLQSRHFSSRSLPDFGSLNDRQAELLSRERDLLRRLHSHMVSVPAPDDAALLSDALAAIDTPYAAVIVGEWNSGKSTFANALLGDRYVEEGVLPTTARITILRGCVDENDRSKNSGVRRSYVDPLGAVQEDVDELRLPVEWLDRLALIDTPGTNAIMLHHERLTQRYLPRADLVLFVTSAERPFSESERSFLEGITQWKKKIVVVVNKIDILASDDSARHQVVEFVSRNAQRLLGVEPRVFAVSARDALSAKIAAKPDTDPRTGPGARQWENSGFGALEEYMRGVLSREERVRSKMLTPLGVSSKIIHNLQALMAKRLKSLHADERTLALIDEQMEAFMTDLKRATRDERLRVDDVLDDMVRRADAFIDSHMTLFNIRNLLDSEAITRQFDRDVLSAVSSQVDEVARDLSDLIASRARLQSLAVLEFVGRRPGEHAEEMVGKVHDAQFEGVRRELLSKLHDSIHRVMVTYDREQELELLSRAVSGSLMEVAVMQVGAASIGGLVAAHLLGASGLIAAGGLALTGIAWLPVKRRRQKYLFRQRANDVKVHMQAALGKHLDREMSRCNDTITESIGPYSRFVRVETEKARASLTFLSSVEKEVQDMRAELA